MVGGGVKGEVINTGMHGLHNNWAVIACTVKALCCLAQNMRSYFFLVENKIFGRKLQSGT